MQRYTNEVRGRGGEERGGEKMEGKGRKDEVISF